MGIKDYLKHLDQEEPSAKSREYDYVYIDCNFMIHYLIYKCKNDMDLYSRVFDYFKYIFDTLKVLKKFILVFDGKYDKKMLTNPKQQTQELRNKYKKESDDYDKQPIYAGSTIISTFKTYLLDVIEKYKKIYVGKFLIDIIDDSIEGEADFKILESIYSSSQDKICIISKDSDMILISYSLIMNKNIHVDIMSNLRPIKFINVNKITKLDKKINLEKKVIETWGFDYVLVVLMLGNDYLPKVSNMSYDILLKNYLKYLTHENSPIISGKKIYPQNLINFITYLVLDKNVKYNHKNLDLERFSTYYNNLCWTLSQYKVLDININYIQDTCKSDSDNDSEKSSGNPNKNLSSEILTDELEEELNNLSSVSPDKKKLISSKKESSTNSLQNENKIRIRNVVNIYNFINYKY